MNFSTALRYPGGKGRLTSYVSEIVDLNGIASGSYVEPFCGGAGVALNLLFAEKVNHIHLNDVDRSVYAFWHAVLHHNEMFIQKIINTDIDVKNWKKQKEIQERKESADIFELGFSTFYLNRTNRSGILKGGIIGGKNQDGKWKIDARFKKEKLIERIRLIRFYADDITIYNKDVIDLIDEDFPNLPINTLVYFDPPYFNKGQKLYENHFSKEDHQKLAVKIQENVDQHWIVSYDNVPDISELYKDRGQEVFSLSYSAHGHHKGSELMIFKDDLQTPDRVYSSRSAA